MVWIDLLLILFLAVVFAGALGAAGWRRPGTESPWGGILLLTLVLFLALWAGRLWITPVGPLLWGVAWVPLMMLGLVLALVLALAAPPRRRRRPSSKSDVVIEQEAGPVEALASLVLWVLMLVLVASIIAGYA